MLNKVFNVVVMLALLVGVGILGFQVADNSLPITILDNKILTPQVKIGEEFRFYVRFIPTKTCSTHTDRALVDGAGIRWPLPPIDYETQLTEPGLEDSYTTAIAVTAENLGGDPQPGRAKLVTRATYSCNFIQSWWPVRGPVREREFDLLPADASAVEGMRRSKERALVEAARAILAVSAAAN